VETVVTEVPTNNELESTDPIEALEDLFTDNSPNIDDHSFAIALLYFIIDFNDTYSTKNLSYIQKHYQKDLDDLQEKLIKKNEEGLKNLFTSQSESTMKEYNIPESKFGKVDVKTTPDEVIATTNSTIQALINQMKDDIRTRLLVWEEDTGKDSKDFDINASINRAVRRLKDTISYGSNHIRQKAERGVQKFVYKPEALFSWVCLGPAPCAWCVAQSEMPPRKIDDWELDHVNGNCRLRNTGEYDFSKEYKALLEGEL
jgi:hypothetical protein